MKILKNKFSFILVYCIILFLFSIFVILDALFIEKNAVLVDKNQYSQEVFENIEKTITDNSYKDKNIEINISYDRKDNADIYIADIKISNISFLKSAFAKNMYGKNVLQTTSEMAESNNAIFAINGDYYGFRDYGFVLRNGIVYRSTARKSGKDACFVIYSDGDTNIINERSSDLDEEIAKARQDNRDILQVYTFGPGLILNGNMISSNEKEDLILNPRTAIGMIEPLHYVMVCVDGRTKESIGMNINQLKEYMASLGCVNAYNLDGGGSSTMWFNGKVINKPSVGQERWVSDIVYIGY